MRITVKTEKMYLHSLRQYWSYTDELTCLDGLLFKGDKLIVPETLQSVMLELIHETHLGIAKCKSSARQVLFWPGMSSQTEEAVAACMVCVQNTPERTQRNR